MARTSLKAQPLSKNRHLLRWVEKIAELTAPTIFIGWMGRRKKTKLLCRQMVESGTFLKLNEKLWPDCYYAKSDPGDVARVEDRTFICSLSKDTAGPTNNWEDPFEMRKKLKGLFSGAMQGRTMYVLPFSMGPVGSPFSRIGVQLTDSPYVVVNMRIMARIGLPVFQEIDKGDRARGSVRSFGRRAACSGPDRRALAVQHGKIHRPFPGDARNLVLRLRLRRQCAAREKMFCLAHRFQYRARRRLDGRAHADSRRRGSRWRKDVCGRGFSQRVRKNEFRDDGSAEGV